MYRLKLAIGRILIFFRFLVDPKSEPFVNLSTVSKFLFNGNYYPEKKYYDFTPEISVEEDDEFKYAVHSDHKIAYPKTADNLRIKKMLNAVLNEQTTKPGYGSPHLYLRSDMPSNYKTIYDIGTAEGYQVKEWIEHIDTCVIFEPSKTYYDCLLKTFEQEVKSEKVILINEGLSSEKKVIEVNHEKFKLDTMDNLVIKYKLPPPHYIKADIEGQEMELLRGATATLASSSLKKVEITTYHKPDDYLTIPKFLSSYDGNGSFSEGIVAFNRIGYTHPRILQTFTPVFRKTLYTYNFGRAL